VLTAEELTELLGICPGAVEKPEGGYNYIYLPALRLQTAGQTLVLDGLLCPQTRDGYTTRLFLSQVVPNRGNNWTTHRILDRTWHTPSWNNVGSNQRPAQMLAEHLRAYR
jgi:hypothetical protein